MSDNSCSKSNPEAELSAQTKNKKQQQPRFATRVPIGEQDSDRVQANKAGLNEYFAAVALSLHEVSKQEKLHRISQVFSPTAELIAPSGKIFRNKQQILSFYESNQSPPSWHGPIFVPKSTWTRCA